MKVLGTCPVCGADIVSGKYGPFCRGKCGFRIRTKMYDRELTEEQVQDLLAGKPIMLRDVFSLYSFSEYDLRLTPTGTEEYCYTGKDGKEHSGYELSFDTDYF